LYVLILSGQVIKLHFLKFFHREGGVVIIRWTWCL